MDTTLKQRILGIIVLMALLGICLTVLLHNNRSARLHEKSAIVSITPQIETTNAALLDTNNQANIPANNVNTPNTLPSQNNEAPPTSSVFNTTPQNSNANQTTANAASTPATNAPTSTPVTAAPQPATPSAQATTSQSLNTMQAVLVSNSAKPANLNSTPNTSETNQIAGTNQTSAPAPATTAKPAPISKVPALNNNNFTKNTASSSPTTYTNNNEAPIVIGNDGNVISAPAAATSTTTAANENNDDAIPTTSSKKQLHKVTSTPAAEPATTHKNALINHNTSDTTSPGETGLVVQVGSFTLPANAETLVDKLNAKGFVATAQKFQTSKGEMTRVIVGTGGLNHADAEALRTKLQNEVNLQGIIVSHEPGVITKKTTTTKTINKKPKAAKTTENTTPITDEI